jgi:hypothetical protein
MSFNHYARKVRDPALKIAARRTALSSCIGSLRWLTGQHFNSPRKRFGFEAQREIDGPQLVEVLNQVERYRNRVLEILRAYERKRIRQKAQGIRHPRKAEREKLYASIDAAT